MSAVRECEENEENNRHNHRAEYAKAYPSLTSRPNYQDNRDHRDGNNWAQLPAQPNNNRHYRQDNHPGDRGVPIRSAQAEPDYGDYGNDDGYIPEYADYDQEDIDLTFATDMWAVAVARADGIERNTGKCFNCRELGHYWRECPKPLKEDFKRLQEHPKRCQDELNGNGGPRKGGQVPQNANVKPQVLAPALVPQAPQ